MRESVIGSEAVSTSRCEVTEADWCVYFRATPGERWSVVDEGLTYSAGVALIARSGRGGDWQLVRRGQ